MKEFCAALVKAVNGIKEAMLKMDKVTEEAARILVEDWVREGVPLLLYIEKERRPSHAALLRRGKREHAHIQRTIVQPATLKWMKMLRTTLQAGIPKAVRAKTPSAAAAAIADWKALQKQGEAIIGPAIHDALTYAGTVTVQRHKLRKQEFDPMGESALDWAHTQTADLVTVVTVESKDAIKAYMQVMIELGRSAQETARALRPAIGLTEPHARAVGRALTKMLDKGVPWDKAMKRTERYAQKLHNYRSKMIARTESSYAQCEGQRQGYKEMGVKRLERIEDPTCCDICAAHSGQIYTIAQAKGVLPEHPQCEGVWVAAA